jgi:nucleotide-binding universal stress UspA family protein
MIVGEDIPLKRILVPLDGSDSSFRAAKYAIKVAKWLMRIYFSCMQWSILLMEILEVGE